MRAEPGERGRDRLDILPLEAADLAPSILTQTDDARPPVVCSDLARHEASGAQRVNSLGDGAARDAQPVGELGNASTVRAGEGEEQVVTFDGRTKSVPRFLLKRKAPRPLTIWRSTKPASCAFDLTRGKESV